MNTFEVLILAIALVFNSWISYLNAGIMMADKQISRKASYAGIMFLFQFLMTGTGIWIGSKVGILEVQIDMMISLSILFVFGLKVLLTGIRIPSQEKEIDYTDNKVTLQAALTEGITPLAIGIAIGLLSLRPYLHWLLIGIFLLSGIIAGLILVRIFGQGLLKLKPGPIGGLLLLAAAIKLVLNITDF